MEKIASQSRNVGIKRVICYIVLIFLAIISLFPIYTMLINCTRIPHCAVIAKGKNKPAIKVLAFVPT